MKLLLIIAPRSTAKELVRTFSAARLPVTTWSSVAGFLRRQTQTLLVSLPADRLAETLALIQRVATKHTEYVGSAETPTGTDISDVPLAGETALVLTGGATVFVLATERVKKF